MVCEVVTHKSNRTMLLAKKMCVHQESTLVYLRVSSLGVEIEVEVRTKKKCKYVEKRNCRITVFLYNKIPNEPE